MKSAARAWLDLLPAALAFAVFAAGFGMTISYQHRVFTAEIAAAERVNAGQHGRSLDDRDTIKKTQHVNGDRITELEAAVSDLRAEIARLKAPAPQPDGGRP